MISLDASYRQVALSFLHCIGIDLKMEYEFFFVKRHTSLSKTASDQSNNLFRTLFCPPNNNSEDDGLTRCGTHIDYGSLTLLIQDDIGGLEVESNGEFIEASLIDGTVLVNTVDLLQRWTNDRLKATVYQRLGWTLHLVAELFFQKHRVIIKKDRSHCRVRQSIVVFIHPNRDALVSGLNGEDSKYAGTRAGEYLAERYNQIY